MPSTTQTGSLPPQVLRPRTNILVPSAPGVPVVWMFVRPARRPVRSCWALVTGAFRISFEETCATLPVRYSLLRSP